MNTRLHSGQVNRNGVFECCCCTCRCIFSFCENERGQYRQRKRFSVVPHCFFMMKKHTLVDFFSTCRTWSWIRYFRHVAILSSFYQNVNSLLYSIQSPWGNDVIATCLSVMVPWDLTCSCRFVLNHCNHQFYVISRCLKFSQ